MFWGKYMTRGGLLALCRELKGWSLREASRVSGVSHSVICQIEGDNQDIRFSDAVSLCSAYGLSLDKLAKQKAPKPTGGEPK